MARARRRTGEGTRWDQDNRVPLNPAAFVTFALMALALAGLFVLFWKVF